MAPAVGAEPAAPKGAGTAQALSGMETMVLDCSTAPDDPRCKGQKGVVLSETFVFPPTRRTLLQFYIGGAYAHGFAKRVNIFSGGIDLGAAFLHGLTGPLPGPKGGWLQALVAEATVGFYGGGVLSSDFNRAGGAFFVRPMFRVGAEFDHFGAFDSGDRKQSGIGVNVMYGAGGNYQLIEGDFRDDAMYFAHGPSISLMLGNYQPISGRLERGFFRLGLLHVPSRNDTVFLTLGGGAAFP